MKLKILSINSNINGTGKTFPITQSGNASRQSTPNILAATSPPLSSSIGTIEIKNATSSFGMHDNAPTML